MSGFWASIAESIRQGTVNVGLSLQKTAQATQQGPDPSNIPTSNGLEWEKSLACGPGCRLVVDEAITSSSVILSRDILGKMDAPDEGTASDEWEWDPIVKLDDDGSPIPFKGAHPELADVLVNRFKRNGERGGGNWYKRADPSVWGQSGITADGGQWMNNNDHAIQAVNEDIAAWKKDQDAHNAKRGGNNKMVYIWNPSNDDMVQVNTDTYGALTRLFLKPTIPFKLTFNDGLSGPVNLNVKLLSVFHPCPVRIESVQYDAVIQIGDFHGLNGTECINITDDSNPAKGALKKQQRIIDRQISEKKKERLLAGGITGYTGTPPDIPKFARLDREIKELETKRNNLKLRTKRSCSPKEGVADPVVVFIPLKINDSPKSEIELSQTKFINTFANKIPSILGLQPDKFTGYPDVPAATQNDWALGNVLNSAEGCFYTWKVPISEYGPQTHVVFMKRPAAIFSADMAAILRLPITPPSDVFHQAPSGVRFVSCPPDPNPDGTPGQCPGDMPAPCPLIPNPVAMAEAEEASKPNADGTTWLMVIGGIIAAFSTIIAIWLGVKFVMGSGGDGIRKAGDWFGSQLSKLYAGFRGAIPASPALPGAPARFLRRTRRGIANSLGIGQRVGAQPARNLDITSPAPTKPDVLPTPAEVANLEPANIPEPTGTTMITNPGFKNKDAFARQYRKTMKAPSGPAPIPSRDFYRSMPEYTQIKKKADEADDAERRRLRSSADSIRRSREAKRPTGPDFNKTGTTAVQDDRKKIGERQSDLESQRLKSSTDAIKRSRIASTARLAKKLADKAKQAKEATTDFDKAVENTPRPKKRIIAPEEPDEDERRPGELLSEYMDRTRPVAETLKVKQAMSADQLGRQGRRGGKRRNRLKTGRQV